MTDTLSGENQPTSRWRLHRAGILNIWQYGVRELDLSGGKTILQGTNGSGKSRTLELELPLCLDGDLRMLGAKGYDSVSVRRLMLDHYDGGPNRIGYTWLELRRLRDDGTEEFLTCGVGVKASKATQDLANSWRFITPARVGIDFRLATADKSPLDVKELREIIGTDAMFADAEGFQARVATLVYGIDDRHRYDDLLHLQRTLRNPDVGVKAVEGQLEDYLSRALPPLDPEIVQRLANQFQDLEAIRDNIKRLRRADESLSRFLTAYTNYARAALQKRATTLVAARDELDVHWATASSRLEALGKQQTRCSTTTQKVADLERLERELTPQIKELENSAEYKERRDLEEKRRTVDALRNGAQASLSNADTLRGAEHRACSAVLSILTAAHRAATQAANHSDVAAERFRDAGLDSLLIPTPPTLHEPNAIETVEYVQLGIDPDAFPEPVQRSTPPPVDVDALITVARQMGTQADRARAAAEHRRTVAATLRQKAGRLDSQHGDINKLKAKADEAAEASKGASARHNQFLLALTRQAEAWLAARAEWIDRRPATGASLGDRPIPPAAVELTDDPAVATRRARVAHVAWISPALVQARRDVTEVQAQREAQLAEHARISKELRALQDGAEVFPPPPDYPRTERTGRLGAPFYHLVEFHPQLSDEARGGLEGALQASGLLDAWVNPDGAITEPHLCDLIAIAPTEPNAATAQRANTLASALVAAPPDRCPVPASVIERLLAAVVTGDEVVDDDQAGLFMSTNGRWRAGNLTGAWRKQDAEYVGEHARTATRQRMIARLTSQLDELASQIQTNQTRSEGLASALATWERHVEGFPEPTDLIAAHAQARETDSSRRTVEAQAQIKINLHAEAFARWQAERASLSRAAAEANLPNETTALADRHTALGRAIDGCEQLHTTITQQLLAAFADVGTAVDGFNSALKERAGVEQEATAAHNTYAENAKALRILAKNLGVAGDELERELTRLRTAQQKAQTELPLRRADKHSAEQQIAKLEAVIELDQSAQQGKEAAITAAEHNLDCAVAAPGIWFAATEDIELAPTSRDEALRTIRELPVSDSDESQMISPLQTLRAALPEDHEDAVDSDAGLLIVHISDGEGRRPVAVAARHAAERLNEDQQKLDTRYREIFERFLLHDLAEHLRRHIDDADDLCQRMNTILASAQSSQGVHVQLSWDPSPALDDATREALELVRKSLAARTAEEDGRLRRALQDRIEAERDSRDAHYTQVLTHALDYRTWYSFTVRVQDTGPDGKTRNRRLRQLSSGETRLVSYVSLFAAAAAFYDALTVPGTRPLRLVLLDEAFERLDDPTITRLLELLAELDMDWIITWPGGSAFSPKIDRMHVYDILRPKGAPGIAFVHTTWDGMTALRQKQ